MFHRRVWRQKWLVLAPFERHLGAVQYAEITGPHEKRYQFGPAPDFKGLPFCVSIAYSKTKWRNDVKPCTKNKATHLIVRPHLFKEWHRPLSCSAIKERNGMLRFRDQLSNTSKLFAGETEETETHKTWVGIELILSAADIETSPDQAYFAWQKEVSLYCSVHGKF